MNPVETKRFVSEIGPKMAQAGLIDQACYRVENLREDSVGKFCTAALEVVIPQLIQSALGLRR